jgi:Domain of unknown function (DUF4214)
VFISKGVDKGPTGCAIVVVLAARSTSTGKLAVIGRYSQQADIMVTRKADGGMVPSRGARNMEWPNAVFDATQIVKALYNVLLQREAEPEGLNTYTTQLSMNGDLNSVFEAFIQSDEYRRILSNPPAPSFPLDGAPGDDERWKKFDAFVELAKFRIEARKERRQHEWRVSLGLWVGMAGGMAAFKERNFPWYWLALLLLMVLFIHLVWVQWNYERNERDAGWAYDDLGDAYTLLGIDDRGRLPRTCWLADTMIRWFGQLPGPSWLRSFLKGIENRWPWLCDGPPFVEVAATVALALAWLLFVNPGSPH